MCLGFSLVCAIASDAEAAAYFIGPGDADQVGGTSQVAIQPAIDKLQPGDTLTIAAGEYAQQIVIRNKATAENPITIRAERSGFTVLRGSKPVRGFSSVYGTRFVWVASVPSEVFRVLEQDTQTLLFEAPALADMDQFRGSYLYDAHDKKLYIHSSDGLSPDMHAIEAYVTAGFGIQVAGAEHVNIEGLTVRGFGPRWVKEAGHGFGMQIVANHITVRQCTFLYNGGGITLNAQHCIIRDSLFVGNVEPGYGELAQIYNTSNCDNNQCIDNIILDGQTHGIRFYNGAANGTAIGNIIKNNRIGLYFKSSRGSRTIQRNVVTDNSYIDFSSGSVPGPMVENFNTFAPRSHWHANNQPVPGDNTLVFGREDSADPRFADPDHLDYRLQSDSPFRGKGPNGTDLGAYPYTPNIYFVSPQGSDLNDGLSSQQSFRTLDKAMSLTKPGVTIYLLHGNYAGQLRPAQSGTPEQPITIRGHGKNPIVNIVTEQHDVALDLTERSHVIVEDVRLQGRVGGARIGQSQGVQLTRCAVLYGDTAVRIADSTDCRLSRLTIWQSKTGVSIDDRSSGIAITSSIFATRGLAIDAKLLDTSELFTDYNNYVPSAGPIAKIADVAATDLAQWRTLTGRDRRSISSDPRLIDPEHTSAIAPGSPCIGAGELHYAIGAGEIQRRLADPQITDVRVRQVTPTTASLTWWTPNTSSAAWRPPQGWWKGHPVISELHYGKTPACENTVASWGDLYHRVTIKNLEPGATYYYRVEIPKSPYLWAEDPFDPGPTLPDQLHDGQGCQTVVSRLVTTESNRWQPARKTIFVSPEGDRDAGGLDHGHPTTLTEASEEVRAGDTVILLDGQYNEMFAPVATGTRDAPITLMAQTVNGAVFDGSAFTRPSAIALMGTEFVTIDGIVTKRFAHQTHGCRAGLTYGMFTLFDTDGIVIKNNVLAAWGNYAKGIIARSCGSLTLQNNVITGFESAVAGRDLGDVRIINNTFYLPLIINMGLDHFRPGATVTIENNLFHGQQFQKFGHVNLMSLTSSGQLDQNNLSWLQMDYNAWYWGVAPKKKGVQPYIGLQGVLAAGDRKVGGIKPLQDAYGICMHDIEPAEDQVTFAGPQPVDFTDDAEVRKTLSGPILRDELVPTLAMFDITGDSPLNHAGKNGAPIGARPIER